MQKRCFFISTNWSEAAIPDHLIGLSNYLAEHGHMVVILVCGKRKNPESHLSNPAIYNWPSDRPVNLRDGFFLFKLIKIYRPDCLLANFGAVNIMMLVGWLMRVPCRIAWVQTLTEQILIDWKKSEIKRRYLIFRKSLFYRIATHILPVSEAVRSDINYTYSVPFSKCKVFYNSLSDPLKGINEFDNIIVDKNKISCIAKLDLSKAQNILIMALSVIVNKYPDLYIEFIGDGPSKEYYIRLASELNVQEKSLFIGELPHTEVLRRIASSVATVLPSISDACPLVIVESLALGTPVVASAVGGIPEMIRDGMDGFLVPRNNPGVLAAKLNLILSSPQLRDTMGSNARDNFLEKFEQKRAISQQAEWLEKLLEKRQ
jgi:glycosyltransferase involved in cell wall biosynthesis